MAEAIGYAIATIFVEIGAASIISNISFAAIGQAFIFGAELLALNALSKKPKLPGYLSEMQDRHHIIRSAVAPRRVVVGRCITSGPLIAAGAVDGPTGNKHEILYMAVALAGHKCQAIESVLLNDEDSGSIRFGSTKTDVILDGVYYSEGTGENLTITINGTPFTVAAVNDLEPDYDGIGEYPYKANHTNAANLVAEIQGAPGYSTASYTVAVGVQEQSLDPTHPETRCRVHIEIRSKSNSAVTVEVSTSGDSGITMEVEELQAANDWLTIGEHLGASDQSADAMLLADLPGIVTTDHRGRSVCYVVLKLTWNADVWYSGIPQVSAVVQGTNEVYDPRTDTVAWSDNPALLVRAYLTSPYGMNVPEARIDDASVIAAANVCDDVVPNGPSASGKRFTCNGSFTLDEKPRDIVGAILSSMGGRLTYWGGKYRIHAAAYDVPAVTITDDDLRGPVRIRVRRPRNELFNGVRGTFVSPTKSWQATDYPPVTNATYKTQDNGEEIFGDLNLPFTTSHWEAQRLAKIELERNRRGRTIELPLKWTALNVRVWDTVTISSAYFGSEIVARVASFTLDPGEGITIVCQEEDADIYAWSSSDGSDLDDGTELPQPGAVPEPPSGLRYEVLSFNVTACIRVYAVPSPSAFVTGYEVQYQTLGESEWHDAPPSVWQNTYSSPTLWHGDVCGIPVGDYRIRVRAVNATAGTHSDWVVLAVRIDPPALSFSPNVSGLELANGANSTQFTVLDPKFVWRKSSGYNSDGTDFYLKDYEVKVIVDDDNEWVGYVATEELTIFWQDNAREYKRINGVDGAYRTFAVEVRARGQQGQISEIPARITVSNPSPDPPTGVTMIASAGGALEASFVPPTDIDWAGTLIFASQTPGFTPSGTTVGAGNCVYDGPDKVIRAAGLDPGATYYYRLASYDAFGKSGLTYSDEGSVTVPLFDPNDATAPATPTGMGSTTGLVNTSQASLAYIEMYWSANAESDLAGYVVQGGRTSEVNWTTLAGVVEARVNAATTRLRTEYCVPGVGYSWRVAAFDLTGNVSSFCAVQSQTAQTDSSAPSTPANVSLTAVVRSLKLTFSPVTAADLAYYEVYASVTSGFTPDTTTFTNLYARSQATAYTYENATDGTYYVKVCAVDWSGNRSSFSSQVSATVAQVTGSQIASGTIGQGNMGSGSVGTSQLRDGETTTDKLNDSAVTTAKRQAVNTKTYSYSIGSGAFTNETIYETISRTSMVSPFSMDSDVMITMVSHGTFATEVILFNKGASTINGTLILQYW